MRKEITCIECPKGCRLCLYKNKEGQLQITGNKCPRGEKYANDEIMDPRRILTTVVKAQGLVEQMVPVRTSQAIPKNQLLSAMKVIKSIIVTKPIKCGDVIVADFFNQPGTNLIATRSIYLDQV